jgi:hypothetical protein
MAGNADLTVRIHGSAVHDGRLALRDIAVFSHELQFALESAARQIASEEVSKRGALPEFVRDATSIEVVGIEKGSFVLTLSLPKSQQSELGEKALESLFTGLVILSRSSQRLPHAFDDRVLKAFQTIGRLLSHGIDRIVFDLKTSSMRFDVTFDSRLYSLISERIARPNLTSEALEGQLLMADLGRLRCRIHLPSGDTVRCEFDEELSERVAAALRQYVRVDGIVKRDPTTHRVMSLRIRNIEILAKSALRYPLEGEIDEKLWLSAASRNPSFYDLYDP